MDTIVTGKDIRVKFSGNMDGFTTTWKMSFPVDVSGEAIQNQIDNGAKIVSLEICDHYSVVDDGWTDDCHYCDECGAPEYHKEHCSSHPKNTR